MHSLCPKCSSANRDIGYGLAAGPIGYYEFCSCCDILLHFVPDCQGMSEEQEKEQLEKRNNYMLELWGPDWKP